jgi:hypothetical protein
MPKMPDSVAQCAVLTAPYALLRAASDYAFAVGNARVTILRVFYSGRRFHVSLVPASEAATVVPAPESPALERKRRNALRLFRPMALL